MYETLILVLVLLTLVTVAVSFICVMQHSKIIQSRLLIDEQKEFLNRYKQYNYEKLQMIIKENLRDSVVNFNMEMNKRLNEKEDKFGGDSWRDHPCNIDRLRNAMQKKVNQFHSNCFDLRQDDVKENCIDIANYSMMIVDRIDMNSEKEV